jgi:hypothetical protein
VCGVIVARVLWRCCIIRLCDFNDRSCVSGHASGIHICDFAKHKWGTNSLWLL